MSTIDGPCLSLLTTINRLGRIERVKKRSATKRRMVTTFPFGDQPIASYRFKYRSHSKFLLRSTDPTGVEWPSSLGDTGDLQMEGIIAPDPGNITSEDSDADVPTANQAHGPSGCAGVARLAHFIDLSKDEEEPDKEPAPAEANGEEDDVVIVYALTASQARAERIARPELFDLTGDDD